MLADNIRAMALKSRLVSVGRNAGRVGDCDLDEIARKRASIIGVTFRTRTPEESLACSGRFIAHLLPAFTKGDLAPVLAEPALGAAAKPEANREPPGHSSRLPAKTRRHLDLPRPRHDNEAPSPSY